MKLIDTTKSVLKKAGKTTLIVAAVGAGVYGLSYVFGKATGEAVAESIESTN